MRKHMIDRCLLLLTIGNTPIKAKALVPWSEREERVGKTARNNQNKRYLCLLKERATALLLYDNTDTQKK